MASIILSSAGASIGNAIIPGIGGKLMRAAGSKVGRVIDQEIGWSNSGKKDGARLESFEVQDSRYGLTIPKLFGRSRVAGNVIWTSDLIETAHKENLGGGKGGAVSSAMGQSRTTYTYSLNVAIAICEGEAGDIETIWADSSIIYQNAVWADGVVMGSSFHAGGADQEIDPLLESWIGANAVPAYQGIAYIVLEGLQLKGFGNRLPNLTFEVRQKAKAEPALWQGHVDPETSVDILSNVSGLSQPIIIDGAGGRAGQVILGGFEISNSQAIFSVIGYDVTGDVPLELYRKDSDAFDMTEVVWQSWSLSSDNRYVAICLQDTGSAHNCTFMLYDRDGFRFSDPLTLPMDKAEERQIIWLDSYHFAVTDIDNSKRGLRIFMRAGLRVVDLGFYDVWGELSALTHFPKGSTQFKKYGDDAIHYMANSSGAFTSFHAVHLSWQLGELIVGEAFDVYTGHDLGAGAGGQVYMHKTGDQEWTVIYTNVLSMHVMSFVPTKTGVTITRPWQTFYSDVWVVSAGNVPVTIGDKIYVLHTTYMDSEHRLSVIRLTDAGFELSVDADLVEGFTGASDKFGLVALDSTRFMVVGSSGYYDEAAYVGVIKTRSTADRLDYIVSKILQGAGYGETDFDVSSLSDVTVDGYALNRQRTTKSALQPLQVLEPFDLIEKEGKLIANKHGYGDKFEISETDLGAYHEHEKKNVPKLLQSRANELDMPHEVTVNYLDAACDYEIGSVSTRRAVTKGAKDSASLNLPLVATPSFVKQLAEKLMYRLWVERDAFRFYLPQKWMGVEPTDVVTCQGHEIRVTSVSNEDGVVMVEGVSAVPRSFASFAVSDEANASSSLTPSVSTQLYMLDLPLLNTADDEAGVYVAVSGSIGWKGATLWRSEDNVNFMRQLSFSSMATTGTSVTELQFTSPHYWDRVSKLQVQIASGELSSCTQDEVLNGANVAVCGGEIIQFQNATLIDDGLYELTDLLRGRRGTEEMIAQHDVGETFVLLQESSLEFLPASLSDREKIYHYRAVSDGGSIEYAQDINFRFSHSTLKPRTPCHMRVDRASGDVNISWTRRARKNAAWVDYIDVPLGEDQELYDLEIMNGAEVVRSLNALSAPSYNYTAAQQQEDWGATLPSSYTIKVYQLGARYGRGDPKIATI